MSTPAAILAPVSGRRRRVDRTMRGLSLVLFVLTLFVNGVARGYVNRAERAQRVVPKGMAG
jgi:hypothetical protein